MSTFATNADQLLDAGTQISQLQEQVKTLQQQLQSTQDQAKAIAAQAQNLIGQLQQAITPTAKLSAASLATLKGCITDDADVDRAARILAWGK